MARTKARKGTPAPDEWITQREAAQLLGVEVRTVERLVARGALSYCQPSPRKTRVLRSEVLARLEPRRGAAS